MVLDGPVQYDPPEPRPHVVVHAKKKARDSIDKSWLKFWLEKKKHLILGLTV